MFVRRSKADTEVAGAQSPRLLQQAAKATQSVDRLASQAVRTEQDHYSALVHLVADLTLDHHRLRTFIYEFARVKLRKDLSQRFVDGSFSEIDEQMRGLEAAIDRLETDFAKNGSSLRHDARPALTHASRQQSTGSVERIGALPKTTFEADSAVARSLLLRSATPAGSSLPAAASESPGNQRRSHFWRKTQVFLAAAIGVTIYVAADAVPVNVKDEPISPRATRETDRQQRVAASQTEALAIADAVRAPPLGPAKGSSTDLPVPPEYGAYALVNGRLAELEQLAMKVPDPRVAISAPISSPSRVHLPTGQIAFVIFRRDLVNSAPDRVSVRVVAQVIRALAFDRAGHAKTTGVEQSWVIRSNTYQMRVAPFGDNPEMVVIRSDPPDFAFPAGRYALILKGVGYDFTVDGPVTDKEHCLERTDALNAPIYSECPSKGPPREHPERAVEPQRARQRATH